jgi:hypothetical protein
MIVKINDQNVQIFDERSLDTYRVSGNFLTYLSKNSDWLLWLASIAWIPGIQSGGLLYGLASEIGAVAIAIVLTCWGKRYGNIDLSPIRVSGHKIRIKYSDIQKVIFRRITRSAYRSMPGRVEHLPAETGPKDVSIRTSDGRIVLLATENEERDLALVRIAELVARRTAGVRNSTDWEGLVSDEEERVAIHLNPS